MVTDIIFKPYSCVRSINVYFNSIKYIFATSNFNSKEINNKKYK